MLNIYFLEYFKLKIDLAYSLLVLCTDLLQGKLKTWGYLDIEEFSYIF